MCCAVNPAVGRELHYAITPAVEKKKVMVIGGGPAGMETARVAALRGHAVSLCEQRDILGGHLPPGSVPEFKKDIRRLLAWYESQLDKHDVAIHLGSRAMLESIEAENPDEIIVATGSKPFIAPIEGLETSNWAHCIEALNGDKPLGQHVSILVIAVGMRPEHKLFVDVDKKFPNVRRIGDCLQPRNIQGAIWDAYEVMRRL